MLNRVRLENFKAWQEADVGLGRITGFFGPNSAGKSSLLQFLLLLKQTRNATDRGLVLDFGGPTDLVNLGTFEDAVHGHDLDRRIRWTLEWGPREGRRLALSPDRLGPDGRLRTRCEVGVRLVRLPQPAPWACELGYGSGGVDYLLRPKKGSETKFELVSEGGDFAFQRNVGRAWPLPRPVKTHLFPSEIRSYFQNAGFLDDFELEYENLMDSIYYLGPLREYPRREYHWGGSSPEDVGRRGESTLDAILAATRDGETRSLGYRKRKKPFQEMIAYWLRELGLIHEFRLEEIAKGTNLWRAQVRTSPSTARTGLADVGVGMSQVLPALVLLYYVPEGATVLLEQPEIHLHPAVQSRLADVMLSVAQARDVQIVVESHSEHLLRRLQRRVAEGDAESDDVKLYFVSTRKGVAHVSDLALNRYGEVGNWPEGFFGDEVGEVAAIARAGLTSRIREQSG